MNSRSSISRLVRLVRVFVKHNTMLYFLGSRDGSVVRALAFHQCGPGSIPGLGVICGLSLLLVLFSAPRGFSPGTPVFPSPQKPTFPNSNLIRMQDLPENHFAVSGASWVNIIIYLFIYLFINIFFFNLFVCSVCIVYCTPKKKTKKND